MEILVASSSIVHGNLFENNTTKHGSLHFIYIYISFITQINSEKQRLSSPLKQLDSCPVLMPASQNENLPEVRLLFTY